MKTTKSPAFIARSALSATFIPLILDASAKQVLQTVSRSFSELQKQFIWTHVQRVRNSEKDFDCWSTLATLNSTHVIRVNVGHLSKSLLAQSGSFAALEDCMADNFTLRAFEHLQPQKQKQRGVTTHAPCRINYFGVAFPRVQMYNNPY